MLDDLLDDASRDAAMHAPSRELAPSVNPSRVRAIKISAEGMDARALNGMRRMLSIGKVPFIVFVFNDAHVRAHDCDPRALIRTLFDHGYRLYNSGVYIYREQELQHFMAGMTLRSTELLFVGPDAEFSLPVT